MIFPVRCFTCGKLIADRWIAYEKKMQETYAEQGGGKRAVEITTEFSYTNQALDELGVVRGCCRRMFLGHVDMESKL